MCQFYDMIEFISNRFELKGAFPLKRKKKGFTLMEMLIVIAIIAILIAVATPVLLSQVKKAKAVACAANRHNALGVITTTMLDNSEFGNKIFDSQKKVPVPLDWDDVKNSLKDAGVDFDTDICPDGGPIKLIIEYDSGAMTLTCEIHKDAVSNYLTNMDKALDIAGKLDVNMSEANPGYDYIKRYMEAAKTGTLPTISSDELLKLFPEGSPKNGFLKVNDSSNPIIWVDMAIPVKGKNGKTTYETALMATTQGKVDVSGNPLYEGFVIYSGEKYYRSTKTADWANSIDYAKIYNNSTDKYSSVTDFLASSPDWELVK